MDERSATILLHAVETYILTGRPAGSSLLQERTGLPVSTATIRAALHELDAAGYLHQPHTSAGRIPTDQGYRYYVDRTSSPHARSARRQLLRAYQQAARRHVQQAAALAHAIAAQTRAFCLAGTAPQGTVTQTGMTYLMAGTTEEDLEVLRELSACMDRAEELIDRFAADAGNTTRVYIGRENPFISASHTSLVVRAVAGANGRATVLTIMGPKRMPYRHYVRVLDEAGQLL